MIKIKRQCIKCNKIGLSNIHNHHITYIPEKTEYLCKKCHGYITSIDSNSRRYYKKIFKETIIRNSELDNSLRSLMFCHFMDKEIVKVSQFQKFGRINRKLFVKEILNRFVKNS